MFPLALTLQLGCSLILLFFPLCQIVILLQDSSITELRDFVNEKQIQHLSLNRIFSYHDNFEFENPLYHENPFCMITPAF